MLGFILLCEIPKTRNGTAIGPLMGIGMLIWSQQPRQMRGRRPGNWFMRSFPSDSGSYKQNTTIPRGEDSRRLLWQEAHMNHHKRNWLGSFPPCRFLRAREG